jgi:hypothetical protein
MRMVGKSTGNNMETFMKFVFKFLVMAIVFAIGLSFLIYIHKPISKPAAPVSIIAAPEQYTYLSANVLPDYSYVITWQRVGDRHCETIVYPVKQSYKAFAGQNEGRVISITSLPNEKIIIWAHDENSIQEFCETIVYPLVDQVPPVEIDGKATILNK